MSRTYGETHNCAGCRFWSEMLAQCIGGGPLEAMCLHPRSSDAPLAYTYTTAGQSCAGWMSGEFGAVDDPENREEDPYADPSAHAGDIAEDEDRFNESGAPINQ